MVSFHEGAAAFQLQDSPFAPYGLADQERFGIRMVQAGRVKLHEFHIGDPGARPVGHRDPVSGGDVGIGRDEVHLAGPAGRQDDEFCPEGVDFIVENIQDVSPEALIGLRFFSAGKVGFQDQVDGDVVFIGGDVGFQPGFFDQRPLDFPAREILRVKHAPPGMPTLAAEIIHGRSPLLGPGEFDAPGHQFRDPRRSFRDDEPDDILMAQAGPADKRIGDVILEGVAAVMNGCNPALGIVGVRFELLFLGDDGDAAEFGGPDREAEAGNAASQH